MCVWILSSRGLESACNVHHPGCKSKSRTLSVPVAPLGLSLKTRPSTCQGGMGQAGTLPRKRLSPQLAGPRAASVSAEVSASPASRPPSDSQLPDLEP